MMIDITKVRLRKESIRRTLAGALGLLLALGLVASLVVPAFAQPQIPHQFWGNVTIGGTPAPEGTPVMAEVRGIQTFTTVDALGRYGYSPLFRVPADDLSTTEIEGGRSGDTVDFYVGEPPVFVTSYTPFEIGGSTELNLEVPGVTYELTMEVVGEGTVTPESGTYPEGDMTITATPDSGWEFAGWSTDDMAEIADPSAAETTLTLDKDKTVTATFTEIVVTYYTLTMAVAGEGTVTPESGTYPEGDMTITATPDSGWEFAGWSTDDMAEIADPSAAETTLTLDKDKTVTATFTELKVTYYLTMNVVGQGTVTPGSGSYDEGDMTITATPDFYWEFAGWSTDDMAEIADPSAASTTLTLDKDKTVTATFTETEVLMYIDLGPGLNIFSTPIALHPDIDNWGELVASAGLNVMVAYYYDGASHTWRLALSDYSLAPCDAIIVFMASAGRVGIIPSPEPSVSSKELYRGFNLIGLAALEDMGVIEALSSVYLVNGDLPGYFAVFSLPINQPFWIHIRDDATNPLMLVGKGYFVFMMNGGTLTGFTTTPID